VVVRLRYISNFTDFDPFLYEQDVDLIYSLRDADIEHADLVIIPGSKNTVQDLLFIRETGIEASIKRAAAKGIPITGVCGGYQMLGRKIADPHGMESEHRDVGGLGLLDVETILETTKVTSQVTAELRQGAWSREHGVTEAMQLQGYEIHMGSTTGDVGLFKVNRIYSRSELRTPHSEPVPDGSSKGSVWGTYIHGIFDNDAFRRGLINTLRAKRGLTPMHEVTDFAKARDAALDKWADVLRESIDMRFIQELIK
jgi:adenosylcobyric acid synthase